MRPPPSRAGLLPALAVAGLGLLAALPLLFPPPAASPLPPPPLLREHMLGRWCLHGGGAGPAEAMLVILTDGRMVARMRHAGGRMREETAVRQADGNFRLDAGRLAAISAGGALRLSAGGGVQAEGPRLPDRPSPGDCLP